MRPTCTHIAIFARDVDRAVTQASAIMLPHDRTILHVLPQEFMVDAQDGIKNPVGMVGSNLDVGKCLRPGGRTPWKAVNSSLAPLI